MTVEELHAAGEVARRAKQAGEAEAKFRAALALDPDHAPSLFGLGRTVLGEGRPDEALPHLERAAAALPDDMVLAANLGLALRRTGDHRRAIEVFRATIDKGGRDPVLYRELGRAAELAKEPDTAREAYARAVDLAPDDAASLTRLADLTREAGEVEEALSLARRARKLAPRSLPAAFSEASALIACGRHAEGIELGETVLAGDPKHADMRFNLAWAWLATGDTTRGWPAYEARLVCHPDLVKAPEGLVPWPGGAPDGTSLVVVSEQGFGDILQFARFAVRLAKAGHKVVLRTEPRLVRLLSALPGVASVGGYEDPPPADAVHWTALQSLAGRLSGGLDDLAAEVPYLGDDEALTGLWRGWLGPHGFRIGLNWRGNPKGTIDRGRSVPVAALATLADIPGVRLVALQKGPGLDELAELPEMVRARIRPTPHAIDKHGAFLGTAALMRSLDLVVSCDTSIAHLAGALGRPGAVLLKKAPDWRWLTERPDSPWYPSLRLFRQTRFGSWDEPMAELRAYVAERAQAARG